jgi:uroporphyrinogen decarboxylase
MTNRERVLASIEHRQPDRTPYHIDFTQDAHEKMVRHYGDPSFLAKLGNCFEVHRAISKDRWKEVFRGIWQDPFGVRWDRSIDKDIGTVCNQVVTDWNLDEFVFPNVEDLRNWDELPSLTQETGDRFTVVNLGFSLFERAWSLHGMENLLVAMACSPAFVHRFLDKILQFNLSVIEKVNQYHIDAMMFGDDWGTQKGVLMGPPLWREFIKPRISEMYRAVHAAGKYVFIHSCGKVEDLFTELIEIGVDVFNPFQPEVLDVFAAKQHFGDRLSFFGGISTQRTLPYGSVQQVEDEVRRLINGIGKDGGYFAAPAHAIPADAKPENIAAMISILQNQ